MSSTALAVDPVAVNSFLEAPAGQVVEYSVVADTRSAIAGEGNFIDSPVVGAAPSFHTERALEALQVSKDVRVGVRAHISMRVASVCVQLNERFERHSQCTH